MSIPKYKIKFIKQDGTVKGAWVVFGVTVWGMVIFTAGVFSNYVADNLVKTGMFVLGFCGMVLSLYTGKKGFEKYLKKNGADSNGSLDTGAVDNSILPEQENPEAGK